MREKEYGLFFFLSFFSLTTSGVTGVRSNLLYSTGRIHDPSCAESVLT